MIRWLQDCEIKIAANEMGKATTATRKEGDMEDARVEGYRMSCRNGKITEDKSMPYLKFGNGYISMALSWDWFEVL